MQFTLPIVLSFALLAVVNSDDVGRIRRVQRTQGIGEGRPIQSEEIASIIEPDHQDSEFWERELGKNGSNGKSKSKSHSKKKGGKKKSGSKSKGKGGSKHGSKRSKKSKSKGGSKKHRTLREVTALHEEVGTFIDQHGMAKEQEDIDFWDRELRKNGSNGKSKGKKPGSKKSKSKESKKSGTGGGGCGGNKHDKAKKCKATCDDKMKWSNAKKGKIYATVKYCGFYKKYSCKGQYNCKDKKAYCRADCHKHFL